MTDNGPGQDGRSPLLSGVGDAPDPVAAVVGDEEGAVLRDGYADGASPDVSFRRHEAGQEVLVLSRRDAVPEGDADDLVSGALLPVPGAVLSGEDVAGVFGGKLASRVEDHLERSGVRLEEDVGYERLA